MSIYWDKIVSNGGQLPGEAYQDDRGVWHQTTQEIGLKEFSCRAEVNGSGKTILREDGKEVIYNWHVFLPVDAPKFGFKERVEIFDRLGESKGEYTVLRFHRDLLHCRMWI